MSFSADPTYEQVRQNFGSPPDSAKPRVWWHWMDGNVTEEGIEQDLSWMHRIGIGGVQNFDVALYTPKVVQRQISFMTPPWRSAQRYAMTRATQLGLEYSIASSPGFSVSGAPWVAPENSMKKLVWSETLVHGSAPIHLILHAPPSIPGPFQDVRWTRPLYNGSSGPTEIPNLYHRIAVIAYPLSDAEFASELARPSVTTSAGPVNAGLLTDEKFSDAVAIPFAKRGQSSWIQMAFEHATTVRSMSIALQTDTDFQRPYIAATLQSSDDGRVFHTVATVENSADVEQTITFSPVRARYFRVLLPTPPALRVPTIFSSFAAAPQGAHHVAELRLYSEARLDHFERQAGFFPDGNQTVKSTPKICHVDTTGSDHLIDLTQNVRADGTLVWTPPAGAWVVMQFGYTLLGAMNRPASPEGTGLEVDKLDRPAVKTYFEDYLKLYESVAGADLVKVHALGSMVHDSWEVGTQNWTSNLPDEFRKRRGYDLRRWLPALAGRVVTSREASERFLWDFRHTLSELLAENYFGQLSSIVHAHGMRLFGEAHESGRQFIGDGMDAKRADDVPMGAMWARGQLPQYSGGPPPQEQGDADLLESASTAHIYGQNLVGAESMTAVGEPAVAFSLTPDVLKPVADREFADGVNLLSLHASVHQPLLVKGPGLTLGPYGQWFTRNETWAEQARPWMLYLARTSYLLQQGSFVADFLYYYGEDSNITALFGERLPPIPAGYAFDFASPDALSKLSVEGGAIVTAAGTKYRALILAPRARLMSLGVLRKLAALVSDGAVVIGQKPTISPSLADSPREFSLLTQEIWGSGLPGGHAYGKGSVIVARSLSSIIHAQRLQPDLTCRDGTRIPPIRFIHRRWDDTDLYFLATSDGHSQLLTCQVRIKDRTPELWRADTGKIEPVSYEIGGSTTSIQLSLAPHDAAFLMFHGQSLRNRVVVTQPRWVESRELPGPWEIKFQPGRGAPEHLKFNTLQSWSQRREPSIRYFSGTATYESSVTVSPTWLSQGARVELDLGTVKNIAEVLVNGTSAGIVWKAPYRLDVSGLFKVGSNKLSILVTNTWVNRLIGETQDGTTPNIFTTLNPFKRDSPLPASGLLGPVRIALTYTRDDSQADGTH